MLTRHVGLVVAIASSFAVSSVQAGSIVGPVSFNSDATSGVSGTATYTHLLDFINDGHPAVINGVTWTAADTSGNVGGFGWSSTGFDGSIPESSRDGGGVTVSSLVPAGSGSYDLLSDFYYHGSATAGSSETLTLTGLTPGVTYETNVYYRPWDHQQTRNTTVGFDEGTGSGKSILIDQNAGNSANYVSCIYTAGPTGSIVMTMTEAGNNPVASWHNYGVSNQVVPEPSSCVLLALGGLGLAWVARRRRSNPAVSG